jgi:hypothetical protein
LRTNLCITYLKSAEEECRLQRIKEGVLADEDDKMKKIITSLFSNYSLGHYELLLNRVSYYELSREIKCQIVDAYEDLPQEFLANMKKYSNLSQDMIAKALAIGDRLVISSLDGLPASYCFFAVSPKKFTFFTLKNRELYFFNCFTFETFRGKGAIYAEVKNVVDKFAHLGYSKANVEIVNSNISSIKAFIKLGFKKTKEYHVLRLLIFKFVREKSIS